MEISTLGWKIIAHKHDRVFLIQTDGAFGRVLDTDRGVLFPEWQIDSILARGYWEPYTSSQERLAELVASVGEIQDNPDPEEWGRHKREWSAAAGV